MSWEVLGHSLPLDYKWHALSFLQWDDDVDLSELFGKVSFSSGPVVGLGQSVEKVDFALHALVLSFGVVAVVVPLAQSVVVWPLLLMCWSSSDRQKLRSFSCLNPRQDGVVSLKHDEACVRVKDVAAAALIVFCELCCSLLFFDAEVTVAVVEEHLMGGSGPNAFFVVYDLFQQLKGLLDDLKFHFL